MIEARQEALDREQRFQQLAPARRLVARARVANGPRVRLASSADRQQDASRPLPADQADGASGDAADRTFAGEAVGYLVAALGQPRLHDVLPLPPEEDPAEPVPPPGPISTHAVVLPLYTDEHWKQLHGRFARLRPGNLKPWYRCLGVLRGLEAKTVVIETYYLCLDYKSEYASFYAHLDAPRSSWTVRLHFFGEPVADVDVVRLRDEQRRSYLGYVVCREGDLPLVGRAVLKAPSYIQHCAAIAEPVNFFGQRLRVRGVPFMQQDQRFAMCAHVALWTMNYTAYRRGTVERRLIADVVGLTGPIHPLRPRTSDGLTPQQAAHMLSELGFRTTTFHTPTIDAPSPFLLPQVKPDELSDELRGALRSLFPDELDRPDADASILLGARLEQNVAAALPDDTAPAEADPAAGPTTTGTGDAPDDDGEAGPGSGLIDQDDPTLRALHGLLDYVVAPYVRSGWPVYCGTSEHALVLVGRAVVDGRPVHFVNDDQNGPYLVTESLPTVSKEGLRYQSGLPTTVGGTEQQAVPPPDRVKELLATPDGLAKARTNDMDHAVRSLVVSVPPRVLLPAGAANRDAGLQIAPLLTLADEPLPDLDAADAELVGRAARTVISVVMGIDYKTARRAEVAGPPGGPAADPAAVAAFSAVQLAEWVVLAEGVVDEPTAPGGESVVWECVYDASSSEGAPRAQLVRFLRTVVTTSPREQQVEATLTATRTFAPMRVPLRVGKLDDPQPDDASPNRD